MTDLTKPIDRYVKAKNARRAKELALQANTQRVCNAGMRGTTYRTGDGEVIQQVRPGSMRAYGLPSRGIKA